MKQDKIDYASLGKKYLQMLKKAQEGRRKSFAKRKREEYKEMRDERIWRKRLSKIAQTSPAMIRYRKQLKWLKNPQFLEYVQKSMPYGKQQLATKDLSDWHKDFLRRRKIRNL